MQTKQRRAARSVYVYVNNPTRESVDELVRQLDGWHAMTYPTTPGDPVVLAFFDHGKADAAASHATTRPGVRAAGVFYAFERGREYRSSGARDGVYRCVGKRGRFVDFESLGGDGSPRVRKQLRETVDFPVAGEYVHLDAKGSWKLYATCDVTREHAPPVDRHYRVAFVLESTGAFAVVETFAAKDDFAANDYAEQHYPGEPWYVLDEDGQNVNGGPR